MSTPPSELVSHEGPVADSAPGALRVLFMDVGPEDQATLETLRPRSWWPRFVPDAQLDADDGAAALAQVLCVFVRTPVTREVPSSRSRPVDSRMVTPCDWCRARIWALVSGAATRCRIRGAISRTVT